MYVCVLYYYYYIINSIKCNWARYSFSIRKQPQRRHLILAVGKKKKNLCTAPQQALNKRLSHSSALVISASSKTSVLSLTHTTQGSTCLPSPPGCLRLTLYDSNTSSTVWMIFPTPPTNSDTIYPGTASDFTG